MRKYHNTKSRVGTQTFDSKLEAQHYLKLMQRLNHKEIRDLAMQVRIELTLNAEKHREKVHYIADFVFFDLVLGEWVVWDSKGMPTDAYKIKRKWLLDSFCGFVFIEHTSKEQKQYTPNGKIPLKFSQFVAK